MLTASKLILLQTVTVCDKYILNIRRLFACSGVQHILCCVFALFFVFFIAPSVFSDVYIQQVE